MSLRMRFPLGKWLRKLSFSLRSFRVTLMLGCGVVELQMNQTELELELVAQEDGQEEIRWKIGSWYER